MDNYVRTIMHCRRRAMRNVLLQIGSTNYKRRLVLEALGVRKSQSFAQNEFIDIIMAASQDKKELRIALLKLGDTNCRKGLVLDALQRLYEGQDDWSSSPPVPSSTASTPASQRTQTTDSSKSGVSGHRSRSFLRTKVTWRASPVDLPSCSSQPVIERAESGKLLVEEVVPGDGGEDGTNALAASSKKDKSKSKIKKRREKRHRSTGEVEVADSTQASPRAAGQELTLSPADINGHQQDETPSNETIDSVSSISEPKHETSGEGAKNSASSSLDSEDDAGTGPPKKTSHPKSRHSPVETSRKRRNGKKPKPVDVSSIESARDSEPLNCAVEENCKDNTGICSSGSGDSGKESPISPSTQQGISDEGHANGDKSSQDAAPSPSRSTKKAKKDNGRKKKRKENMKGRGRKRKRDDFNGSHDQTGTPERARTPEAKRVKFIEVIDLVTPPPKQVSSRFFKQESEDDDKERLSSVPTSWKATHQDAAEDDRLDSRQQPNPAATRNMSRSPSRARRVFWTPRSTRPNNRVAPAATGMRPKLEVTPPTRPPHRSPDTRSPGFLCKICKKPFSYGANHETACQSHPGSRQVLDQKMMESAVKWTSKNLDELRPGARVWDCCWRRVDKSPGCRVGRHVWDGSMSPLSRC